MAVQIIGITNVLRLNVPYIAVDPEFPHHLNSFDNVPVTYPDKTLVNITSRSNSIETFTNVINYTAQAAGKNFTSFQTPLSSNKILLFLTNFGIEGQMEFFGARVPITIIVEGTVLSTETYSLTVQAGKKVNLHDIGFSQIIFNEDDVSSTLKYLLVYEKVQVDLTTDTFIPIP